MPDVSTVWDAVNGRADWLFTAPDLVAGGDLTTAIILSLFTDRTADLDDVIPDGSADPRGWWGDTFADRPIGSKLWLRYRNKADDKTPAQVKDDITDALQWLLDDGVAARIDVITEWTSPSMVGARIIVFRQTQPPVVLAFPSVWGPMGPAPMATPPLTLTGGAFDFSDPDNSALIPSII